MTGLPDIPNITLTVSLIKKYGIMILLERVNIHFTLLAHLNLLPSINI